MKRIVRRIWRWFGWKYQLFPIVLVKRARRFWAYCLHIAMVRAYERASPTIIDNVFAENPLLKALKEKRKLHEHKSIK